MKRTLGLLALLSVGLVGCGGGGESGFDNPNPGVPAPVGPGRPSGSALRLYRAGDTWEYRVAGNLVRTRDGVTEAGSGAVEGTYRRQITSEPFNGAPAFRLTETWTLGPRGGIPKTRITSTWFTQDAARDLTVVGKREDNYLLGKTAGTFKFFGTFGVGGNRSGSLTFTSLPGEINSNGNENKTLSITSAENVGARDSSTWGTFKVSVSQTDETNYSGITDRIDIGDFFEEGTVLQRTNSFSHVENWNAAIGAFVKAQTNRTQQWDEVKDPQVNPTTGEITFVRSDVTEVYDLQLSLNSFTLG